MAHISWSSKEFSLEQFESSYEYQLPVLMEVTQGYCGYGEDFFTFSTNEVYRVAKIVGQTRVVAKDENAVHYSIPVAYPLRFRVLSKTSWIDMDARKPLFLDEILTRCEIDGRDPLVIAPEDTDKVKFWQGTDKRSSVAFQKLEVVDTFEDRYLIANSIIEGHVYDGSIIPLFLGIKVRVAEGLRNGTQNDFNAMMEHFKKTVGNRNDKIQLNKEIMIYDSAVSEHGIYDYIEPATYVSCSQASRLRDNVSYELPSKPRLPRQSELYTDLDATRSYTPPVKSPRSPKQSYIDVVETGPAKSNVRSISKALNHLRLTGGPTKPKTHPKPKPPTKPKPIVDENVYDEMIVQPSSPNNGDNVQLRRRKDPLPDPPTMREVGQSNAKKYNAQSASAIPITWETNTDTDNHSEASKSENTDKDKEQIYHEKEQIYNEREHIYHDYTDVPKSIRHMTKLEVADCLRLMKLEKYVDTFLENDVDGELLLDLDEGMLQQDFGFSHFEALKVMKFAKKGWRPK